MTNVLVCDTELVRTITLNRPAVRNAIDIPLRIELAEALEAAHDDDSVGAVVLTGSGGIFSSGGDISTMQRMEAEPARERAELAQRVIRAIWRTPKPVVAAVEGAAFGAGAALAFACDRVVAARDARFATTFTNVGLAGDMGIFASLPRRVGPARARQMLLMPEPVSGEQALSWGLVDALAEPGGAIAVASADAAKLARGPRDAYGAIKMLLAASSAMHPFEMLDEEVAQQSVLFGTDDFAEGAAAFQEKRRPVFGQRRGAHP